MQRDVGQKPEQYEEDHNFPLTIFFIYILLQGILRRHV